MRVLGREVRPLHRGELVLLLGVLHLAPHRLRAYQWPRLSLAHYYLAPEAKMINATRVRDRLFFFLLLGSMF